jgi:hypothetical protein
MQDPRTAAEAIRVPHPTVDPLSGVPRKVPAASRRFAESRSSSAIVAAVSRVRGAGGDHLHGKDIGLPGQRRGDLGEVVSNLERMHDPLGMRSAVQVGSCSWPIPQHHPLGAVQCLCQLPPRGGDLIGSSGDQDGKRDVEDPRGRHQLGRMSLG